MILLWAALSGVFFALIPVGIRASAGRGIEPRHLMLVAMPACLLAMLPEALAGNAPTSVWIVGVAVGGAQFGAVLAMRWGLAHGPISPLWCAQMLGFMIAVLWGWWHFHEPFGAGNAVAIAAALGSVALASLSATGGDGGRRRMLPYAAAIIAVYILNGSTNAAFKHLAMDPAGDLMRQHGSAVFSAMYLTVWIGSGVDFAIRPTKVPLLPSLGLGLLLAVGSLGGVSCLRFCLNAPASVVFTVNTAASLVVVAVVARLLWNERPGWPGFASVVLALLAAAASSL